MSNENDFEKAYSVGGGFWFELGTLLFGDKVLDRGRPVTVAARWVAWASVAALTFNAWQGFQQQAAAPVAPAMSHEQAGSGAIIATPPTDISTIYVVGADGVTIDPAIDRVIALTATGNTGDKVPVATTDGDGFGDLKFNDEQMGALDPFQRAAFENAQSCINNRARGTTVRQSLAACTRR
jgi:hypothetical protein